MSYKILAAVALALILVVFVELVLRPAPEAPPNLNVNEATFKHVRQGMSEADVETLLGQPHKTFGGAILRVESRDSGDFKLVIQERRHTPDNDWLNIYQGRNEESIRVLFSIATGHVMAAEYRVADLPVLYEGQRNDIAASPLFATSERGLNPEYDRRKKVLERHNRVNQILDNAEPQQKARSAVAPKSSGDEPPPPLPKASATKQEP